MSAETLIIVIGALAGGFVNGLTGFGTGMTALVLWLHVLPPLVAAPLVIVCSVAAQIQSLPGIWHALDIRRLAPFVIGGLAGIPLGVWLLTRVSVSDLKLWLGALVSVYCAFMLLARSRLEVKGGGRAADGVVGLAGGVLGGIAGLSGPLPTIWASLRGWGKDERRAIFQGFNLTILAASFLAQATAGLMTLDLVRAAAIALPGTLIGAAFGQRLYRRLDDVSFDRIVHAILLAAGLMLMWSGR